MLNENAITVQGVLIVSAIVAPILIGITVYAYVLFRRWSDREKKNR